MNYDIHLFQNREGKWRARIEVGSDTLRTNIEHTMPREALAEASSLITLHMQGFTRSLQEINEANKAAAALVEYLQEPAREALRQTREDLQMLARASKPRLICSVSGRRCVCKNGPCVHVDGA